MMFKLTENHTLTTPYVLSYCIENHKIELKKVLKIKITSL